MEELRELVTVAGSAAVLLINVIVLAVVVVGTIEAFLKGISILFGQGAGSRAMREVYVRYGHWLIGALTFQIAADIIETSFAPTWQDIGRLGAVAAIRALLGLTLDHDLHSREAADKKNVT